MIPYFEVPVIHLGPLPLHGFGLLVACGFLAGGWLASQRAKRVGLDPDVINRLIGWLVVGTFVGGHLGYLLMYEPGKILEDPMEIFKVWRGLSSFGGFVVCVPLSVWFFRKNKLPVLPYVDCLAYGLTIGWFLGRCGCTVAHDHPGVAAFDFPLAIYCRPVEDHMFLWPEFMRPDVDHRLAPWGPCADHPSVNGAHDMGFYEALWSLGMFGVFWLIDRVPRKAGLFGALLGMSYGPARFAMDFLRPETTDDRYFGFTPAQYWSVIFFVFCTWMFVKLMRTGKTYWTVEGAKLRADDDADTG
jgi:phosphatidylglycerol:prolipoprotein diacylglycerol transferase